MYLLPLVAIVNGSTISNAHISKDFFGVSVIFSLIYFCSVYFSAKFTFIYIFFYHLLDNTTPIAH